MLLMLLLFFLPVAMPAEWSQKEQDFKFAEGQIHFYNRSACAKKSQEPTTSVFLIVDNVNVAKSAFRLSKLQRLDSVQTTNYAIQKFRYGLSSLVRIISDKLLSGELPLIDDRLLSDEYLALHWARSRNPSTGHTRCRVVKKFSSLYSHLRVSKPDRVLFEEMAKDMMNLEESFTACSDFSDISQPEVALLQFDLSPGADFKNMGFRFWYSLKVYLSWAYRYAPEADKLFEPFNFLFKSADLEEMVLFFSNGCESVTPSTCSDHDLNLENLRHLTESSKAYDFADSNYVKPIPGAPTDSLFSRPLPVLEDDLLNLGDFETTSAWLSNFRGNFIKTRGYQKIRLHKALSNLQLISGNISSSDLERKIAKDSLNADPSMLNELYYLCSEYRLASDKELSFLRKKLRTLKDNQELKKILPQISAQDYEKIFSLFFDNTEKVMKLCEQFERRKLWGAEFEVKKAGFAPWYQQLTMEDKNYSSEQQLTSLVVLEKPFLGFTEGQVICHTGVHCARLYLDAIMALSAVSQSISTLSSSHAVNSTNFGNPYSAHMACGAYDPWAKRNKVIFDLFHDLTQAAVFSLLPTPVYVSAELDPRKVTSFSTLIKEGKVFYDPQYDSKKVKMALIADLGPLMGVPCAVSIAGSKLSSFQFYTFNGISFSGCRESSKVDLEVSSADEISEKPNYRQSCLSCAINLQSASSSLSLFNPGIRASFFLIKGVVKLISNLRDPHDLARSWSVSPQQIALSYRFNGSISKSCSRKLLAAESCLPRPCESLMLEELTSRYVASPVASDFSCLRQHGRVKIKECVNPVYLSLKDKLLVKTTCPLKERK